MLYHAVIHGKDDGTRQNTAMNDRKTTSPQIDVHPPKRSPVETQFADEVQLRQMRSELEQKLGGHDRFCGAYFLLEEANKKTDNRALVSAALHAIIDYLSKLQFGLPTTNFLPGEQSDNADQQDHLLQVTAKTTRNMTRSLSTHPRRGTYLGHATPFSQSQGPCREDRKQGV